MVWRLEVYNLTSGGVSPKPLSLAFDGYPLLLLCPHIAIYAHMPLGSLPLFIRILVAWD